MGEKYQDNIREIIANMTPDDVEDTTQVHLVGKELVNFMKLKELRVDLWMSVLMAVQRAIYENQVAKCSPRYPQTYEEFLIEYSVHSLKMKGGL